MQLRALIMIMLLCALTQIGCRLVATLLPTPDFMAVTSQASGRKVKRKAIELNDEESEDPEGEEDSPLRDMSPGRIDSMHSITLLQLPDQQSIQMSSPENSCTWLASLGLTLVSRC